jgi:hypothetical protein
MTKLITEPFLMNSIFIDKSQNINISLNKPTYEHTVTFNHNITNSTILKNEDGFKLYSILNIPDTKDIPCPFPYSDRTPEYEAYLIQWRIYKEEVHLMTSKDGIIFSDPIILDIDQNLVLNFYPHYVKESKEYIAIGGIQNSSRGLYLLKSTNGVDWLKIGKILSEEDILPAYGHMNHFDSLNTILFNPFNSYYYIYLRHNTKRRVEIEGQHPRIRYVQWTVTKYLNVKTKEKTQGKRFITKQKIPIQKTQTINEKKMYSYYSYNASMYPNSKYILSFPGLYENHDKKAQPQNMNISMNGLDWETYENILEEENQVIIPGGLIAQNNKFYIFTCDHHYFLKNSNIMKCLSFEIDRLITIKSSGCGYVKTTLIKLISTNIYVNFKTFHENGYIKIILYDKANCVKATSIEMTGNEFSCKVKFDNTNITLNDEYYIQFSMCDVNLYSMMYEVI